jgi:glycine/serine hydroxymethyltransferase
MNALYNFLGERSAMRNLHQDETEDECFINLCAFDNVLSHSAAHFLRSPLGNRYRIGAFKGVGAAPNKSGLLLRGFAHLDELEHAAHEASRALFGGVITDLRPLSGVHATTSIILAATDPGDTIYSISPDHGGHFATRHIAERAGRVSRYLAWDIENHNLAIENIARQFAEEPPSYILLDHGTPLAPLKVALLRQAAGPRALIDYDASHTLGLTPAACFESSPRAATSARQYPQVVSRPAKALIVFRTRVARRVQKASMRLSESAYPSPDGACVTLLEMQIWAKRMPGK